MTDSVQGRLSPNMPFCHIDYFELEILKIQPVQDGHLPLLHPPERNHPRERYPVGRHPYHQRMDPGLKSLHKQTLYFFSNLLLQAQTPLTCQFFTNILFLCLKGIKTECFGYFFQSHISMSSCTLKKKFSFLLMSYVILIIRPAKEPSRGSSLVV